MPRKKADSDSGEASEEARQDDGLRRIDGKTEDEWVEAAMSLAGYSPLLFVGKDRKETADLVEQFRSMHLAIMEIRAMFGSGAACKVVYSMYSAPFVDRGQVMLRQIQKGDSTARSIEGPPDKVGQFLEGLLSGKEQLPPRQVRTKDLKRAQARYNWVEENHGIPGARGRAQEV